MSVTTATHRRIRPLTVADRPRPQDHPAVLPITPQRAKLGLERLSRPDRTLQERHDSGSFIRVEYRELIAEDRLNGQAAEPLRKRIPPLNPTFGTRHPNEHRKLID